MARVFLIAFLLSALFALAAGCDRKAETPPNTMPPPASKPTPGGGTAH
jgi:hypothetical protein